MALTPNSLQSGEGCELIYLVIPTGDHINLGEAERVSEAAAEAVKAITDSQTDSTSYDSSKHSSEASSPFSTEDERQKFARQYGGSLGVRQAVSIESAFPYWE